MKALLLITVSCYRKYKSVKNCTLKDCIIDRHCIIPDGMEIGVDKALDSKRFRVSSTGKVVLVTSAMLKKIAG